MDAIPLHPVRTALGPLLAAALEPLRQQCGSAEIGLRLDVAPDVPEVLVDPEKIAWAVATLAGNAIRYARRGSRRLPGGAITVTVAAEGEDVVIRVGDDGPGIPQDKLERLFRREPGAPLAAGVALSLARDVAIAHGGTLDVVSRTDVQHGTEVTLRLPASATVAT